MLIFNLAALSNAQLHKMVRARCKAYGRVLGVSIHRRSTLRPGAFALVDMSSVAEVKRVIKGIGDAVCGASALIRISQDAPSAETALAAPQSAQFVDSWLDASARYLVTTGATSATHTRAGGRPA